MKKQTEAEQKLTKARVSLILDEPFFGVMASNLRLEEQPGHGSAATDGRTLFYDPAFINELAQEQVKGLFAHEILHIALEHTLRIGNRDHVRFNQAADYAINGLLKDRFDLPGDVLYNPAYDGKSAEEIYRILGDQQPAPQPQQGKPDKKGQQGASNAPGAPQKEKTGKGQGQGQQGQKNGPDPQPGPDPARTGGVMPSPDPVEDAQEIKAQLTQAMNAAAGDLSADIRRLIKEILDPPEDWREILRRYLSAASKAEYSWTHPARRFIAGGLYLPSLHSPTLDRLTIAVDTSGSITDELLSRFLVEVKAILSAFPGCKISLIYCDAAVAGTQELDAADLDSATLDAKGGGGTRYSPAFTHADQAEDPTPLLVYLTDGYCSDYPKAAPDYPVIWTLTPTGKTPETFKPPFGESIKMA